MAYRPLSGCATAPQSFAITSVRPSLARCSLNTSVDVFNEPARVFVPSSWCSIITMYRLPPRHQRGGVAWSNNSEACAWDMLIRFHFHQNVFHVWHHVKAFPCFYSSLRHCTVPHLQRPPQLLIQKHHQIYLYLLGDFCTLG